MRERERDRFDDAAAYKEIDRVDEDGDDIVTDDNEDDKETLVVTNGSGMSNDDVAEEDTVTMVVAVPTAMLVGVTVTVILRHGDGDEDDIARVKA